jgi:hypothetical protein
MKPLSDYHYRRDPPDEEEEPKEDYTEQQESLDMDKYYEEKEKDGNKTTE